MPLLVIIFGGCGSAGSHHTTAAWPFTPRLATAEVRAHSRRSLPAVDFVERALHGQGLRFGTDGTVGSLYGYLEAHHALVPKQEVRPGDVVFFDLAGRQRCADHVGLVDAVEPSGRVIFREVRGGGMQRSYFHPLRPTDRRDEGGRVLNSFLRPKRPNDPADTPYFAGQMLCAVARGYAAEN